MKSVAEKCLDMTSLFEAELLVRLILRQWNHPLAHDDEFANGLLEDTAGVLRNACDGEQLIPELLPPNMNFVAAAWYVEQCAVDIGGPDVEEIDGRRAWLEAIRRSVPSCFCDPDDLQTS
jgi:hypothetical protein